MYVKQNKPTMYIGLFSITICLGYLAYWNYSIDRTKFYTATKNDGTIDTVKQLWLDSDKYNNLPTQAHHESCLLQLLHVRPTAISEIQNEAVDDEEVSGNIANMIAKSYCQDCCKRNHEVFNLVTEIYRLNLKLGRLREFVKAEFEKSFCIESDSGVKGHIDSNSEELLQRNKFVRYEIAAGLDLMSRQNLTREPLSYIATDYSSSGDSNDGSEAQDVNPGGEDVDPLNSDCLAKEREIRDYQLLISGRKNQDFLDEIIHCAPSSPKDSGHRSSNDEFYEPNKLPSDSSRAEKRPRKSITRKTDGADQPRLYCAVEGCSRQKPFQSTDDLECHRLKVHEGVSKPYRCSQCELSFADEHGRRKHLQFVHLQTRGRVCEVCGRRFPDIHNLNIHSASHSSERPHQCKECDASFKIERSLKTHVKRVHRNERPHSCDRCGKSFYTGFKLKNHIQSVHFPHEKPFTCEICGRGFPIQGYLYMHKRLKHKMIETEDNDGTEATYCVEESVMEGSSLPVVASTTENPAVTYKTDLNTNADIDHGSREFTNISEALVPCKIGCSTSFTSEEGSTESYLEIESPHSSHNSSCPMDLSQFQPEIRQHYTAETHNTQIQDIPDPTPAESTPTTVTGFLPHHFL
ncbi:unnamed protein product [Allacma fusca]|uniref:C2H2-type domain-containing protein n=1 Tax=Allacma fusca TaxID=39272 RepID=A0A8J2LXN2_9HEXA|nr:unnamed protein product [Allacma fusca]